MSGASVIQSLWDFVIGLAKSMGIIWEWLSDNHYIGIKIDLLGIDWGFDIVPLHLTGAVLLVLIVFGFIKSYIPVA